MKTTYKIIKILGEGTFGKAFLAVGDKGNKKNVVIKQIVMEGMSDQEKRETFNEAIILKKLHHPNIIKFHEVFIQQKPKEALNIVTEFADGGDLSQKISEQKKKPFTESQIIDYITQICLALQHLHNKKILHRDLKSGNVFLMKSGIIKLGDFGMARSLKRTWEKAKTMVGTPYYLSPEIISNKPYDAKSDIWALGVLLYELMTFKMPFNAVSLPLLSIKINRGVYKMPTGNYSNAIKDLLKRCLTLQPEKRPSINEILKLPLIKDRINNYLKEVQYDKDLLTTMAKKYKDNKILNLNKKIKIVDDKNSNNKTNNENGNNGNIKKENEDEIKPKKIVSDKKKVRALLKKKKEAKKAEEVKPNTNQILENKTNKSENNQNLDIIQNLTQTNFLVQKNQPNFQEGKVYKEDEIGKALYEKGYKDLLDEKKENFDVNKMNEDQYNQMRLLNNLHNIANDKKQNSDNEEQNETLPPSPKKDIYNNNEEDIDIEEIPEIKVNVNEVSKEKMIQCQDENKEIETIKKDIEKEIGIDLLKEIMNILDKRCDKTEVKFDRELLCKDLLELKNFEKIKLDKAIEKLDEIFAIFMKDKLFI